MSPALNHTSPGYSSISPQYSHTSPSFSPMFHIRLSPFYDHSRGPTSPAYSPAYSPMSPALNLRSPGYSSITPQYLTFVFTNVPCTPFSVLQSLKRNDNVSCTQLYVSAILFYKSTIFTYLAFVFTNIPCTCKTLKLYTLLCHLEIITASRSTGSGPYAQAVVVTLTCFTSLQVLLFGNQKHLFYSRVINYPLTILQYWSLPPRGQYCQWATAPGPAESHLLHPAITRTLDHMRQWWGEWQRWR